MQTSILRITHAAVVRLKVPGAILLTLAVALPAFAALGGTEMSIEADRAHMQARWRH